MRTEKPANRRPPETTDVSTAREEATMNPIQDADITDVIGKMPYRMAFAGGWIAVVVALGPDGVAPFIYFQF